MRNVTIEETVKADLAAAARISAHAGLVQACDAVGSGVHTQECSAT